jgi:hypothetical protein
MEAQAKERMASNEWTDRMGSFASSICALHCAICGLLPVVFTALGLGFLLGHEAEWILSITAISLGLGALVLGWRQHRSGWVAGLLVVGIVGLLASRGLEMGLGHEDHHGSSHQEDGGDGESDALTDPHEEAHPSEPSEEHHGEEKGDETHLLGTLVGVLAGMMLLLGHIFNIRMARRCREECGESDHEHQPPAVAFDQSSLSQIRDGMDSKL